MICPNCKRELSQMANFCRYCGARLPKIDAVEHPTPPQTPPAPSQTPPAPSQTPPASPQTPPAPPQPPTKPAKSRVSLSVLAGLALLLVFLGLYLKHTSEKLTLTPAQAAADIEAAKAGASVPPSALDASASQPESEAESELDAQSAESYGYVVQIPLLLDDVGFFDIEMKESLAERNRELYRSHQVTVAWSVVETVEDISLEDYTDQTFQKLQLGNNDILCAIEISSQSWYTVCGSDIVIDDALIDCVSLGIDNILSKRNAEAINDFYSDLGAWFNSYNTSSDESLNVPTADTPATEEPAQTQTPPLPDGEYILTVYSDRLTPADEGVYADVDVRQYVTLDKEVLWDAKVGDIVDLTQFNAGFATVTNVSEEVETYAEFTTEIGRIVAIQLEDKASVNLGRFIYRENFGCWRGIERSDPSFTTYDMGISTRVLFPPTTGITDYLTTMGRGGAGEYGMVHKDIRDYFAIDGSDKPETASVVVTLQNGVVTEAEVPYHP